MSGVDKRTFSQERDAAVECWLRDEVVPTYDEMKADPASGIPIKDVVESIEAHHVARLKDGK